jgi:hypothetical protein
MKTLHRVSLIVLLMVAMITLNLNAKNNSPEQANINKGTIENLKCGICSDNNGLRRSSIYFAGKYKINEVVPNLARLLYKQSTSESEKRLIISALYAIGSTSALSEITNFGEYTTNTKLKMRTIEMLVIARHE